MPEIRLLQTEHCSLCDQAFEVLLGTPVVASLTLVTVDIAYDDALLAQYGEHIPVLLLGEHALQWPFTATDVTAFVQNVLE